MISVTLQDLTGQIRVAMGMNVRPIIILANFHAFVARDWKVTDVNTMLTSVNVMAVPASMVANVKMNLEHFIAIVHQDMVEHIVKRILTSVLINHVSMEEHALMQLMIFNVLVEKVRENFRRDSGSDFLAKIGMIKFQALKKVKKLEKS